VIAYDDARYRATIAVYNHTLECTPSGRWIEIREKSLKALQDEIRNREGRT